jgi:argininosuccinate synthase
MRSAARVSSYSVNEGMWGISVGGKETHDSWQHLPDASYPSGAIDPALPPIALELKFVQGAPVALNGQALDAVELIDQLNTIGAKFGIGRGIHLGDTILGVKGRVGFQAPAAALLIQTHRELEKLVLSAKQLFWKEHLGNLYGSLMHEGQYFDPLARDLEQFLASTQTMVSGDVRVELRPHCATVQGVRSPHSLMDSGIATYGEGAKAWTGSEAAAYAKVFGIAQQMYQAKLASLPISQS